MNNDLYALLLQRGAKSSVRPYLAGARASLEVPFNAPDDAGSLEFNVLADLSARSSAQARRSRLRFDGGATGSQNIDPATTLAGVERYLPTASRIARGEPSLGGLPGIVILD